MSHNQNNDLIKIVSYIDKALLDYYESDNDLVIEEFVFVSSEGLPSLAQTIAVEKNDELNIGIVVQKDFASIISTLESPIEKLTNQNLGFFSVLVEEVSHFRLLCETAESKSSVSKFDLELQGEFDKIIVAMELLKLQTGQSHIDALLKLMFEESIIYLNDEVYQRADHLAGCWWFTISKQLRNNRISQFQLRQQLQKLRYLHGEPKKRLLLNAIEGTRMQNVA